MAESARAANRKYLTFLWLGAAGLLIPLVAAWWTLFRDGMKPSTYVALAALPAAFAWVFWQRGRIERKMKKLLRDPDPGPLLNYYEKLIRPGMFADADAGLAQSKGIVLAMYGRFDQAREELASIDWQRRPPLIQAARQQVEILLQLFQHEDHQAALRLARQARAQVDVPALIPGSKKAQDKANMYVEMGEALAGHDGKALESLERRMNGKMSFLLRAHALWAVATAQKRLGNKSEALSLEYAYREIAPHCVAIGE